VPATAAGATSGESPHRDEIPAPASRSLTARRQVRLVLGLLFVLIVVLVGVGIFAADRLYTSAQDRYVREAFPLRAAARDLTLQLVNEETGVRGYVITGDPASLAPYRQGRRTVKRDLTTVSSFIRQHPELAPRIAEVRAAIAPVHEYLDGQVKRVAAGPGGQRSAQANVFAGKARFDRFRHAATALQRQVDAFVVGTEAKERSTYRRTLAFLIVGGALAAAIALGLFLSVPERLRRLYRSEEEARRQAEEALEVAERGARASRALEHVRAAVVLLDDQDVVRYWNTEAESYFGRTEKAALGSPASSLIPQFDAVEAALRRGTESIVPFSMGDQVRWLTLSETEFAEGRVLVFRDVSEERALERARTEFIATASHELRTPIAAVYGAARTLRRTDLPLPDGSHEQFLEMIETESERLARIVEQILLSARIEQGEMSVSYQPCDLHTIAQDVVATLGSSAPNGVELALSGANGDSGPQVRCDKELLRQVLLNLVENAIKYSPDGGRIDVTIAEADERVELAVSDQGLGIPANEQEKIFERFYRLDPALARGIGGTGLGLYISRELIRRMGGRIRVASIPGAGSTFTVELPLR
jgi:two-component system phosphate regulon sensor histidine kinase PhoR